MSFFFAALFVFFVFWRPQEWILYYVIYGWPILDVIVLLSVASLFVEVNEGRVRIPWRAPQVRLLFGLWFAAILSHVAHTYFAGMVATIVPMFKICFFTFLLFTVLDRPERLRRMAWIFVVLACTMTVHALLQQTRGYGFAGMPPLWVGATAARPAFARSWFFGIFSDPNDMSQFFAVSIPFAFALFRRRSFLTFLLGCAITYLLVRGMLTTHSRGGFVALAAVSASVVVLALPARWMPALLALIVLAGIAMTPFSGRILDQSAHDRVVFWGEANYAFKRNPIFGVGFNMLSEYTRDRAVHNAFVACYAELGLLGYWFWFGLIYAGIVGSWRSRVALSRPRDAEEEWLRRFAGLSIAAMVGYAASSYFLSRTFVYPVFFLMAILGAVARITEKMRADRSAPLIDVRKDLLVTGTVLMLLSVVYIYISIIVLNKLYYG